VRSASQDAGRVARRRARVLAAAHPEHSAVHEPLRAGRRVGAHHQPRHLSGARAHWSGVNVLESLSKGGHGAGPRPPPERKSPCGGLIPEL
jgi:hypothetical protein